ncbi:MAG: DUF1580 domain-containing protein [Planctomycetales bacterium]|nr:DUF1580 domain-containing protein [Planctomycetales bacterium]
MIDPTTENLISIGRASRTPPLDQHVSTTWRWALHGLRGHKLETIMVGGRRKTSVEAISRFLVRINGDTAPPAAASRAHEAAEREADALGI